MFAAGMVPAGWNLIHGTGHEDYHMTADAESRRAQARAEPVLKSMK